MRRFDVYFLQKRDATGWETLERAQSASVLVTSVVRAFDGEENAELRVVAGDWNETIGEWEFSQIFFVDRSSMDLSLGEPTDEGDESPETSWPSVERDAPEGAETRDTGPGDSFAAAIHAAQTEADRVDLEGSEPSRENPAPRRRADYADDQATSEDLRSLGFTRASHDEEEPIGPPPDFRPEPRRRGRAFFMIGTVLIALILILGAAAALMVAFKVEPAPRYIEMLRDWRSGAAAVDDTGALSDTAVMPQTAGDAERHAGVADGLQGRWSAGDCDTEYVEFRDDSYVVKAPEREPYAPVAVSETLEDEYTWYVRRSETLVEHYQKLGANDIQLIGDTSADGFTQRTSEVFTRCPA